MLYASVQVILMFVRYMTAVLYTGQCLEVKSRWLLHCDRAVIIVEF